MMFRTIFQHSIKPPYCNTFLNCNRILLQSKQLSYSLGLFLKHCNHENKFQFVSSIFNSMLHRLDLKYTHTAIKNEVQSLCDFILSQNSENWESERIEELNKSLTFILSSGYSSKEIQEQFLTSLCSRDCSLVKLKILADIEPDIVLLLPLLSLPLTLLTLVAKRAKYDKPSTKEFSNRISYLSCHLELEPSELIPALAKHSTLLTMKFNRLNNKMNILKNANISSKYIVKDLWIFNYNEQLLASRIQAAMNAGIELKPWMLRCSKYFFESILIKFSAKERILDGETVQDYLARKLNCNIEYVNYMMEKNKHLKSVNIPKLEQMINFLNEKGYTPEEIRLFPRIFCSSIHTLNERLEEYQHLRSTLPTLPQLYLSNRKYISVIRQKKERCMLN